MLVSIGAVGACTLAQKDGDPSQAQRVDAGRITSEFRDSCQAYLRESGQNPVDYIVNKFKSADVVLIGETHHVRENCEFVRDLISPLYYQAGVHILASEFSRETDTEALDKILTAQEFDRDQVIALFREGPWPTWGFREYIDILQAVWELNHSLPEGAEPFRVVGIDSGWDQYELWFNMPNNADRFKTLMAREQTMIKAVEREALEVDKKALVHCGFDHSLTCQGERLGTVLRRNWGQRIFQIGLHRKHYEATSPAPLNLFLDSFLNEANDGRPIGFDVVNSPFAGLYDPATMHYRVLRDKGLSEFVEGYVFLKPLNELGSMTWIDGFVDDAHFERAKAVAERLGWLPDGQSCDSATELNAILVERFPPPKK